MRIRGSYSTRWRKAPIPGAVQIISTTKKKILGTGCSVYELMNEAAVHTKTIVVDDRLSIVGIL